jgi:UDP-N-acetylmuramoyl-tripeptide--D-alanyl-D-alanine ligase
MEPRPLAYLSNACQGKLVRGDPKLDVSGVCTDTRKLRPGDLFFAITGDRFDGHAFLPEAIRGGAAALVVRETTPLAGLEPAGVILVDDPRKALGRLAGTYRQDFNLPVVAVCGSNGKTTTKELIGSVLRQAGAALCSEASFNNDIGVPWTLLQLQETHRAAVLEAGTNHPGELRPLISMIAPRYGVITSIGREHLEFFGNLEGVVTEEGSVGELLPADGVLFVNGDSPWADALAQRTSARVVRVGLGANHDWQARQVRLGRAGTSFRVVAKAGDYSGEYRVNLLGRHQATNALFAISLAAELKIEPEKVRLGLLECQPPKMRLQLWESNGVQVLDDAYNANSDSLLAALQTLQEMPCKGRRIAVLGDMAELGQHSEPAHEEAGRRAAELGVAQLFAVGKMAGVVARGARGAGLTRVFEFAEVEAVGQALRNFLKPGDVVLLKASRATRLERVTEVLRRAEKFEAKLNRRAA